MLELIVTLCLADGTRCIVEQMPSTAKTYSQCMMDQAAMAELVSHYPNYTIKKWHCNGAKQEANL